MDSLGGLAKPAHILIAVNQRDTEEKREKAKQKADSIYQAISQGADFATLAKAHSDDPGSKVNGGEIGWIQPGQTVPQFEKVVYSLNIGQVSQPVLSDFGYHIIRLDDKKNFVPYDSVKTDIITFIDRRGIRDQIIDEKIEAYKTANNYESTEKLLEARAEELSANDSDMANLIREYHDGLLLFEISNREVWEKAQKGLPCEGCRRRQGGEEMRQGTRL